MHQAVRPVLVFVVSGIAVGLLGAGPPSERGRGVIAADHPLSSEAGAWALEQGGNAVDAAVAAALATGVVGPAGSGLGGGGFAVVQLADGRRKVLDFREVAPKAASREMFVIDGKPRTDLSQKGGLAVAVPTEGIGLAELVRSFGELSLMKVAEPAIRLAERGHVAGPHLMGALSYTKDDEVKALFSTGGRLPGWGEVIRRKALGKTLRAWAKSGGAYLQSGDGAKAMVRAARRRGGVLSEEDLAAYRPAEREPVVASWRGKTVVTMPPPSSGGVGLAQMLKVVEGIDLPAAGRNNGAGLHILTEVMKQAYADRARYLGDSDFVKVPLEELLHEGRLKAIREAIDPEKTFPPSFYGSAVAPPTDAGTTHISVIDGDGNGVALTSTINTSFGSGVVVPELGIILNNEMDDFSVAPGVPNAFGLVGNEQNAIAPGKRPLSSMTPTLVVGEGGKVEVSLGASGGAQIISSVFQVLLDVTVFGMDPQEAVSEPRIHHQWQPDVLVVEPGFSTELVKAMEARGHVVKVAELYSCVQVVVDRGDHKEGGSDPRKGGRPVGVW